MFLVNSVIHFSINIAGPRHSSTSILIVNSNSSHFLSLLYIYFHSHAIIIFCCLKENKFPVTQLLLSFPNGMRLHDYPHSQAEKLLLSNPNLTICQLFKKNYQISLLSWGQVFCWYVFLPNIPMLLIFLGTWKNALALHSKVDVLGYSIDHTSLIGRFLCNNFTLLVPI